MAEASKAAVAFAAALNEKFPAVQSYYSFGTMAGRRFDRITLERDGIARSVHAFVERETGLLVKAAGWTAPARRVDGSLQSKHVLGTPEGFEAAVAAADRFGGYLYA